MQEDANLRTDADYLSKKEKVRKHIYEKEMARDRKSVV